MKKVSTVSRYLLGLIFFVFGIAGLFNLIPPPPNLPEGLVQFMTGLMAAKYFMPLLKATEALCGLLLIVNVAPALMLLILAPISIHIFFVHAFLTPGMENLVVPVLILVLLGFSATNYWDVYKAILKRR